MTRLVLTKGSGKLALALENESGSVRLTIADAWGERGQFVLDQADLLAVRAFLDALTPRGDDGDGGGD
jgi:hypothetical protein